MPKVTIISGIYNCSATLAEAIDSILAQSFDDWNWVLCDDGSIDDTYRIAEQYGKLYPQKFVLLKNEENKGLNYTLNKCLSYANGQYIARMDGDDRCASDRLEKEVKFLNEHPEFAIVSSDMCFFDETGTWGRISHPTEPNKADFVKESPFCHAPCMVRREAYLAVNGYTDSPEILRVEDYHLWMKMYQAGYKGYNIHEPLYEMRDDRNAYSRRKFKYRLNEAYVKWLVIRNFKLPAKNIFYVLRPVVVGILPDFVYDWLHKGRLRKMQNG